MAICFFIKNRTEQNGTEISFRLWNIVVWHLHLMNISARTWDASLHLCFHLHLRRRRPLHGWVIQSQQIAFIGLTQPQCHVYHGQNIITNAQDGDWLVDCIHLFHAHQSTGYIYRERVELEENQDKDQDQKLLLLLVVVVATLLTCPVRKRMDDAFKMHFYFVAFRPFLFLSLLFSSNTPMFWTLHSVPSFLILKFSSCLDVRVHQYGISIVLTMLHISPNLPRITMQRNGLTIIVVMMMMMMMIMGIYFRNHRTSFCIHVLKRKYVM